MIPFARPSPGKKKAFKVLVAAMLVFWMPVLAFIAYKGMVEPLVVLADKVETLGVLAPHAAAPASARWARQEYLYAAQGRMLFYQGSRLRWTQSSRRILKIWYNKLLPRLAFIPDRYFAERFPPFALAFGLPLLFGAYVRLIRKETLRGYMSRRIREEVG